MDGISSGPKEEAALRVVVRMPPQHIIRGVSALPQGPGLGGPGGLPLASPSRGLTCFWPGLVGLEAAGILPGVQQGQREARLEGAGRSRFPGVQGKGAGFPEAGDLGSGAEGREVGGPRGPSPPASGPRRAAFPRGRTSVRVCLRGAPTASPSLPRQDYISRMDPASTLGLSAESIHGYSISHVKRVLDAEPPELPPCRRGVTNISVSLKGQRRVRGRAGGGGTGVPVQPRIFGCQHTGTENWLQTWRCCWRALCSQAWDCDRLFLVVIP